MDTDALRDRFAGGSGTLARLVDPRVLALTVVLLAWYVLGTTVPDGSVLYPLAWPAFGLAATYLYTVGLLFLAGGMVVFWAGFVLFCLVVAAASVAGYDRVRDWRAGADAG